MAESGAIQGSCDERFEPVREAFQRNFDEDREVGASVAVYLEGEPVVDLWGGFVDEERSAPWERDTITNIWSTSKTVTNLCALLLADHGELNLHAPVATYWPEFKANDKERIEVRHLLGHTSGLAGWTAPLAVEDLYDWEKATGLLAAQAPWWTPGTASGYHTLTQGFLVGEVIRRVTGQSLGTFFAEEVATPLDADVSIGLRPDDDVRTVRVVPPSDSFDQSLLSNEMFVRTFANPPVTPETSFEEAWRRSEIPAANGQSNARGVGAAISVLSNLGEARGVRLLSSRGCEAVLEEQSNGTDLVLGVPLRFGMGFGLGNETVPVGPRGFFWAGLGGSVVVSDFDARLTVAYVMNRMEMGTVGDVRGYSLVLAAATSLEDH